MPRGRRRTTKESENNVERQDQHDLIDDEVNQRNQNLIDLGLNDQDISNVQDDQDNQLRNQHVNQDEQSGSDEHTNDGLAESLKYLAKQQLAQHNKMNTFTSALEELRKSIVSISKRNDQTDPNSSLDTENEFRFSNNNQDLIRNLPESILKRQDLTKDYIGVFKGTDGTYTAWTENFRQYLRYLKVEDFIDHDMLEVYPNVRKVKSLDAEVYMLLYSKLSDDVKAKLSTTKPETYKAWSVIKQWYDLSSSSLLSKAYKTVMFTKLSSTNNTDYVKQYQDAIVEFERNKTTLEDFVKWCFMRNLGEDGKFVRVSFKDQIKKYPVNKLMAEVSKVIEPSTSKPKVYSTQHKGAVAQNQHKQSKNTPVNINVSKVQKNEKKYMPKELKKSLENYKCEKCGRLGHCGIYCWSSKKPDEGSALTIMVNNISSDDKDAWIFDSGASIHICNNEQWFVNKFKKINKEFKTSNEGSFLIAEGIGTVELTLLSDDVLTLENVYYCPNAITNLMTNIGLNKAIVFEVNNRGICATLKTEGRNKRIKFAEIKDGQNVICLKNQRTVFAVATRKTTFDQIDQGVIKPHSTQMSSAKLFNQGVKRGVGRPRKLNKKKKKKKQLAKSNSNELESILTDNEEVNRTVVQDQHQLENRSVDQSNDQLKEDSNENTWIEVDTKFQDEIKDDLNYEPLIIRNDCFDANEPTRLDPEKTNELWRAVAQRNNIKTAYNVHVYTGHAGQNATKEMCKYFGINDTSYECILCKQLNLKLTVGHRRSLNESVRLMQLVHMDICQPYGRLEAHDGSKYILTILEDYSKFISIYLLENKSDAVMYFKQWLKMFERITDKSLIEVRTDNGREFLTNEFDEFLRDKGIKHSLTVPHLHQQNGSVERANRTIEDRIFKLIEINKFPKKYWSEAALYATHQYNRTINTKGMIPYSIVFRRVDDRKTFDFGERVCCYRPKENGKLERNTGYFMGWSDKRRAYRVLPEKGTFVLDDVYFLVSFKEEKGQTRPKVQTVLSVIDKSIEQIPKRYNDIFKLNDNSRISWQNAVKEELQSMIDNKVFEIVDKNLVADKIIGTQYVFKIKEDQPRARLVARGDWQSAESFSDTYAPTLQFGILRLLLKLAINSNWFVYSYDVKKAFLNAELHENVFIELPLGIELINSNLNKDKQCVKLKRALYGLKQAGREWHLEISSMLRQYGFKSLIREPTIFVHNEIKNLIVAVYVDDMVVICEESKQAKALFEFLSKKYQIHDRGQLDKILGVNVKRTVGSFELDLKEMIKDLCDRNNVVEDERIQTPLIANEVIDPHENGIEQDFDEYASLLGSLLYVARMTRPDILAAVIQLCQFQQKPKVYHMRKAIRVLTYLCNTINIIYEIRKSEDQQLVIYSDSSVGNFHDKKSQQGCAVMVGGSLISYCSTKTKMITQSANESEIVAATEAIRELLYFKQIKCALEHGNGTEVEDCKRCVVTPLNVDNTGVQTFAAKGFGTRTKYLDIRFHKIKELSDDNKIQIVHTPSKSNCADIFTKNQLKEDLLNGRELIGLKSSERVSAVCLIKESIGSNATLIQGVML